MREGGTRGLAAFDCFWKNMKWWIVTTMFVFNRCDNAPYSYSFIKKVVQEVWQHNLMKNY